MTKRSSKLLLSIGLPIALIVACLTGCSFLVDGQLWFMRRATVTGVEPLEQIIPFIEQYHLSSYRNQDWCQNIAYSRGAFSSLSGAQDTIHTCNYMLTGAVIPFDDQAKTDFARTHDILARTGVLIHILHAEFDRQGHVHSVEFRLNRPGCLFCGKRSYVYQPHYGHLPPDIPKVRWHTTINDNWYLVEEDWN